MILKKLRKILMPYSKLRRHKEIIMTEEQKGHKIFSHALCPHAEGFSLHFAHGSNLHLAISRKNWHL